MEAKTLDAYEVVSSGELEFLNVCTIPTDYLAPLIKLIQESTVMGANACGDEDFGKYQRYPYHLVEVINDVLHYLLMDSSPFDGSYLEDLPDYLGVADEQRDALVKLMGNIQDFINKLEHLLDVVFTSMKLHRSSSFVFFELEEEHKQEQTYF